MLAEVQHRANPLPVGILALAFAEVGCELLPLGPAAESSGFRAISG